eukprot:TRINITY_DN8745_c0_g1_i2.p3 TRINITY_DN8745_c0_g1~~TRINITY_DN8745_c0_g1_i2.p3  ORF type:complete len:162 (-),score=38.12 TRINITY_DN8745_c0_g1_i2:40-525(-)
MNVYKLVTGRDLNAATLTGAIDIIVVRHPDGSLRCTPFHVRFGKLILFHATDKIVHISVNGKPVQLTMKLGAAGEAFFVEKTGDRPPKYLATSPAQNRSPSRRALFPEGKEGAGGRSTDAGTRAGSSTLSRSLPAGAFVRAREEAAAQGGRSEERSCRERV